MSLNQKKFFKRNSNEDIKNFDENGAQSFPSCEDIPRVEHYLRHFDDNYISRPTIKRLHRFSALNSEGIFQNRKSVKNTTNDIKIKDKDKFGLFSMVFVPTFMNLLGTALFLRIGLIVGEAGVLLALLQVLIGTVILIITVLSMSAICTNGDVGNGGFYFLISRSLGPEIGAMFGCIYFLTNAIMVAFSIIGVCIEVQYILQSLNTGIIEVPSDLNDKRVIGLISLLIVSVIPFISLDFEAKSQWILFGTVIISMIDFFVGLLIPPTDYQKAYGIVGWDKQVFTTNLFPNYDTSTFFSLFSLYTSSIAGDFTGMSMSSTLKNPKVDIPKGSILAIVSSSLLYGLQIIFFGCTVVRYSSGIVSDVKLNNYTCNESQRCDYGLIPDQYIMSRSSALTIFGDQMHYIEPLFTAGLLAQSLSSAMCSFIAAPRILQSLGFDDLLPFIKWFSKGSGKHSDPRRGYILTFIIALIFIVIANFDIIANVTSNCYLFSWFLLNIAVFHSEYIQSTNWRPSFKYYNKWLSLLCGIICFVLMFCFDWISSVCLLVIVTIIWIIISYYKPDVDWGQTTDSQLYKTSINFAHKLNLKSVHVKNFRPSILLMSGTSIKYNDLISFANDITRHRGMLVIADVVTTHLLYESRNKTIVVWNNWLNKQKIKCFYKLINANSISEGTNMMIQCCGLGSYLSPNIVMIGFKDCWKQCPYEEVIDYFNIIHNTFRLQKSLIIYRNNETKRNNKTSETDLAISSSLNILESIEKSEIQLKGGESSLKIISNSNEFKFLLKFIDIYWLYDEGGLTLLIPYIISQRKNWRKHKLRIFTVVDSASTGIEQNMKDLLDKFRIDYFDIIIIEYPEKQTSMSEILEYFENNSQFLDSNSKQEIIENLYEFQAKTSKYMALRGLLERHSAYSSLIVMTIEIPREDMISAHLFIYLLDILSSEMTRFLFIRGNQENVLTFYCD